MEDGAEALIAARVDGLLASTPPAPTGATECGRAPLDHRARWGLLLPRTDPDVPKHRGMTAFVVDMHADGVEVRPLYELTGEAEFNEVYLTGVRIPDVLRLGDVGGGWAVALTTLMNERAGAGREVGGRGGGIIEPAVRLWRERGLTDPVRHDQLLQHWVRAEVL